MNLYLEEMLGIECKDDFELIEMIRSGLPASAAERLASALGLSSEVLWRSMGLQSATAFPDRLDSGSSDKVVALAEQAVICLDVFVDRNKAAHWLTEGIPALAGRAPVELLDTCAGIRVVGDIFGRIQYGVFS